MTRIYLTRHGETHWNVEGRMQGRANSSLTDRGCEQAKALAKRLERIHLDAIVTSPSNRALQTAEILRTNRPLDIHLDEHFLEMDVGDWEGRLIQDIINNEAQRHDLFWNQPHLFKTQIGEDYYQVRDRVLPRVRHLVNEYPDKDLLIVSHAVVLKLLMAHIERRPLEKLWEGPHIHGTSLSIVEINGESTEIVCYADTSHFTDKLSYN